jgi:hypothetical protein
MEALAKAIKIEGAFEDPHGIRKLVERHGPYPSIASYLPPSATRATPNDVGPDATLPWFRGNWAVNGRATVDGADAILRNARFRDAAARLFGAPSVTPTTVVINVNAPMPAGAVHLDIPSFRGANRDRYPLPLLQAMGTSRLFEEWRVVEAGAVSWFYDGEGGTYDYWPEGLDGPMRSAGPPFDNVALVADNDRMYHRIGRVGSPEAHVPLLSSAAEIEHVDGCWAITDGGEVRARYSDAEVRISVLWKAVVPRERAADGTANSLTPELVADIITADLHERGIDTATPTSPLSDDAWIDLVHATYYPMVVVDD